MAMANTGMEAGTMAIFNPAELTPADSVDFCGASHGTCWDIVLGGAKRIENVRFPAYRVEKSRCWGTEKSVWFVLRAMTRISRWFGTQQLTTLSAWPVT